jgi:predicted dehydrogenase
VGLSIRSIVRYKGRESVCSGDQQFKPWYQARIFARRNENMTSTVCRWGILGTANIARKNWQAIRLAGNSRLSAVASRDRARAEQFIRQCQDDAPLTSTPMACGSYEELLRRDDIDAVYLPLPTALRKEWVLRAAEAGKHILCEKPCGLTAQDLRAMLEACRAHRVQFMDGVMFMHSRRLPLLRQVLDDGQTIGTVLRITSQFSFKAMPGFYEQNIRAQSDLEPLGCLGDLGWYNVRFSLCVMQEQLPLSVTGHILAAHTNAKGGTPVPMEFSGELFFPGGASASLFCSFRAENQQWATVSGVEGYLTVSDFVLPLFGSEVGFEVTRPVFRVRGCTFNMEGHSRRFAVSEYSNGTPDAQETNMIRVFSRIVTSGQLEPQWGENALRTQQVIDACLESAQQDGGKVKLTP